MVNHDILDRRQNCIGNTEWHLLKEKYFWTFLFKFLFVPKTNPAVIEAFKSYNNNL